MKTITAAVIVGCVAIVSVIGAMIIVVVTGHDLAPFSIAFGSISTSAAGFLAILPILRRQARSIETVKRNTNGTLSKLIGDNAMKDARLALALSLLNADQGKEVLEHTMSRDELIKLLREDSAHVAATVSDEEI